MVQGTGSSVGKSLLVAGLCRLMRRRGIDVAPFKAQNMSNNAAVTLKGGEIGRAQAFQARAAGVEPTVDMNPVLLKPLGDRRAEVVVLGSGRSELMEVPWRKRSALLSSIAYEAFDRLRAAHELILVEGAGSPAEINLRAGDYVNMGLARHGECPVLIVADIDRGGAFASLFGTWALLEEEDRRLIKGFILNKFRGDPNLLEPAPSILEERTRVPVLGVVPYTRHLLPEEDGAGDGFHSRRAGKMRIGGIALPHASNLEDFDPLRAESEVEIAKIERPRDLLGVDAIVIPGTRNTPGDLVWMRENGLFDAIRALARDGVPVVGLCGGYQMLGAHVDDPSGIESSEVGRYDGLGLLSMTTELAAQKERRLVTDAQVVSGNHGMGWVPEVGTVLEGYEIHHGRSIGDPSTVWLGCAGRSLGHGAGRVWGCYLHGLFENDAVRRGWLRSLGVSTDASGWSERLDSELDRWADVVEESLDADALLQMAAIQ